MEGLRPFHLAIPVHDLKKCRAFYRDVLGLEEGRSSEKWVDFNLFGHQLVIHEVETKSPERESNPVDGHEVPVPHFGILLRSEGWQLLADRLRSKNVHFLIEPYVRFKGQSGEQSTMFFRDPSGNALEFKAFADDKQIFQK
ncbi:MAG: VOC family protein [Bacteroidota bacterium]